MWSKGGSCIILRRKATKISRKHIKEDVNKHQRKACSSTLESFRGNEPEIVNGKSLLCYPPVFSETGFTGACALNPSSKERDVPCKCLAVCPAAGVLRGSRGTHFIYNTLLPGCSKCSSFMQWSLFQPASVQKGCVLWKIQRHGSTND